MPPPVSLLSPSGASYGIQALLNPLQAGGLYGSPATTNPNAGIASLYSALQGSAGAGQAPGAGMASGAPAPTGPADMLAAALGVPTQQAAMQQANPGQYGQPGDDAMWQAVQSILGSGAGGPGPVRG